MAENATTGQKPLARLFRLFRAYKEQIWTIYVYGIFSGLISLSVPLGFQAIINMVGVGQLTSSWKLMVGLVLLAILASGLMQIGQYRVSERIQRRIFVFSAFEFVYRLPNMKYEAISEKYLPELVNRFFDTVNIQKGVSKLLIDFSTAAFMLILSLLLLCFYHPFFILFSIVVAVFTAIVVWSSKAGLSSSLMESKYKYQMAYWIEEVSRVLMTFKQGGVHDYHLRKTDYLVSKYLEERSQHFNILQRQYLLLLLLKILLTAGLIIPCGIMVNQQQMNVGQFVAAELIVLIVISSAEKLILSLETLYDVLASIDKLGYVLDVPLEQNKGVNHFETTSSTGLEVELRELTYPKNLVSSVKLLHNFNLHLKANSINLISGGGEREPSILLKLLAGLLIDFEGQLLYNGLPLCNLNINHLRAHISHNLEGTGIFEGSLIDNISFGSTTTPIDFVTQMVDIVDLTSFIQQLPEGYNTIISPNSRILTREIVQKIIFARCLVAQPKLLLIDNGLNQLPKATMFKLLAYLNTKKDCTVLIVGSTDLAPYCQQHKVLN
jgi:ABC-type bacteriocin/lantibiotic exporter with double-glycine peptidase domain